MRELFTTGYNTDTFVDENTLYKEMMIAPVQLSKKLTQLYGKSSDMFPLLSFTEGQGLMSPIKVKLNDTQFEWGVMGKQKYTDICDGLVNAALTTPGINFTPFDVVFETNRFIGQWGVMTPDKQHILRIQGEPKKNGAGKFVYTLQSSGGSPTEYIGLSNFVAGKTWVATAPSVAASKSDGNRSNRITPGKMISQFGYSRFTQNIAGNVANKTIQYELPLEGGGTTNRWMPFEMQQFELNRRVMLEQELWISKYNRDINGVIHLKDEKTGEPIPKGPGVFEILDLSGNHDTFNPMALTVSKLVNTVNSVFANRTDKTPMEIILYTGAGGLRAFNAALMADATQKSYFTTLGDKIIGGDGTYMTYGNYFTQLRTIDGHLVTVRESKFFNNSPIADMDKENGEIIDGYPLFSYNLVFLDHSMNDDGDRNIVLTCEEGRELITNVYKGMSPLPPEWKAAVAGNIISDTRDIASYEVFMSQGFAMKNNTTSFWLEPEL